MKKLYRTTDELPALLRKTLPEDAQELYVAVFNRTWETLAAGEEKDDVNITARAHLSAQMSVDAEFTRDEQGCWHHDPVGEHMPTPG